MSSILVVDDSELDRRLVGGLLAEHQEWLLNFAGSGAEALEKIQSLAPDLVVSDIQMPELDGLQLVTHARLRFPDVPVVLVTGHGSEQTACEALRRGAASYVPKGQLADRLAETVDEVLGIRKADRTYDRLIGCLARTEFTFHLHNDPDLIDPLVDLIQQMVRGMKLCDFTERVRVGVALKEALFNAVYRGNLEIAAADVVESREKMVQGVDHDLVVRRRQEPPYAQRLVKVEVCIRPEEARFVISDEGPGFDVARHTPAPNALPELDGAGRGLRLMRSFMDEVQFNIKGNEVTLVKRRGGEDS